MCSDNNNIDVDNNISINYINVKNNNCNKNIAMLMYSIPTKNEKILK